MNFRLFDDQGKEIKGMGSTSLGHRDSSGLSRVDVSVQYEAIKDIPDYIIIQPYLGHSLANQVKR